MDAKDKRIDAYIAKVPDYAKAILSHIAELVHTAAPGVKENLKWGTPSFENCEVLCVV